MAERVDGREPKEKHLADLLEATEAFSKSSTELSKNMLKLAEKMKTLTWVIAGFTAILTFLTIYQIFFS